MKSKLLALIAVAAIAAAFSVNAHAGSVSANSTVTINFSGACELTAASPTITYSDVDTSSTADLTVKCSSGLPWTLTADGGLNASGETRRGKNGTEYLTYRVYKDAGLSQEVGVTTNVLATGTGTGANQIKTAYLAVKAADNATNPTVGTYPDTLGWTLSF